MPEYSRHSECRDQKYSSKFRGVHHLMGYHSVGCSGYCLICMRVHTRRHIKNGKLHSRYKGRENKNDQLFYWVDRACSFYLIKVLRDNRNFYSPFVVFFFKPKSIIFLYQTYYKMIEKILLSFVFVLHQLRSRHVSVGSGWKFDLISGFLYLIMYQINLRTCYLIKFHIFISKGNFYFALSLNLSEVRLEGLQKIKEGESILSPCTMRSLLLSLKGR